MCGKEIINRSPVLSRKLPTLYVLADRFLLGCVYSWSPISRDKGTRWLWTQRSDLLCTGMLADSKAQRPRTHLLRCACSPTGPTPVFEERPPRNECIREQVWMCCVMKTRVWGWTTQPQPANSNATHSCACQNKWCDLIHWMLIVVCYTVLYCVSDWYTMLKKKSKTHREKLP